MLICHKNTIMLLADDVIPWIYEKPRWDFRSPLTKTLDWSIEMLGRECYSTAWALHKFIKTRVATETMTDIIPGCGELTNFKPLHTVKKNFALSLSSCLAKPQPC